MERIGFLINKLKEQYERAESQNSLLITLQMLYRELQPKIDGAALIGNISIVVPGQMDLTFLEKSIEQKYALDLTPNNEGKQVFELSVEPADVKDVSRESSNVNRGVGDERSVSRESSNVSREVGDEKSVNREPEEFKHEAANNVQLPINDEPLNLENATAVNVKKESPNVDVETQDVKPIIPVVAPEKPTIQPEAISVNDKFHEQETLNSRFAVLEKEELPIKNDTVVVDKPNDFKPIASEKDARYLPQQPPPGKPEPPPIAEAPVVEVPVFKMPPVVATSVVPAKELHETISVPTFTSYNDKQEKRQPELFNILKAEPLKDLKKAISINDRFQYISHLFMGDETIYERSIKTINHFNVYSEAEFWIRRELSTKMGWDKDDAVVQQFMALVGRRFA